MNTAVSTPVQVCVWIFAFISLLRMEVLSHGDSNVNIWRNYHYFPKHLYCFTFPPAACENSNLSTFLPTPAISCLFIVAILAGVK